MKRSLVIGCCLLSQVVWSADYQASVRWADKVSLSLPVSGVIDQVTAVPGQPVAKGDVLLKLQEAPFLAEVSKSKAALADSSSHLREAKRDYNQARELFERAVLSAVSLENAKMKYQRASAARQEKKAQLDLAEYGLRYSRLLAPFDAWVLQRNIEPGQAIVSTMKSEPLITVARRNQYLARLWMGISEHRTLKVGSQARVNATGKMIKGHVYALSLEPATSGKHAGDYWVDVKFIYEGNPLRQGEKVEVSID